jgi:hypothetical protein
VLTPASEVELSEAVAAAKGPLRIWAVARGPSDGRCAGEALSVAGLAGSSSTNPAR